MNNWDIDHLNVKTVFLHGKLDEKIYMEQPEGAKEPGKEDWIYCLNKSLYGQRNYMTASPKKGSHVAQQNTAILAIHVDNMPVSASSPLVMSGVKATL